MCEMFAITAAEPVYANELLKTFFSHSKDHPTGWGMAILDDGHIMIEKEPVRAIDSGYLKNRLYNPIESTRMFAHIRRATVGEINFHNTHPFVKKDMSGKAWVLMHNGTIFDSPIRTQNRYNQKGTTDSDWILFYLIDQLNRKIREVSAQNENQAEEAIHAQALTEQERREVVEKVIRDITPGNKVNLVIYDGDYFYVHKNQQGTLYVKQDENGAVISTTRLDYGNWEEFPQNQMVVYKDGKPVYYGQPHENTYVYDESHYIPLYMDYANL